MGDALDSIPPELARAMDNVVVLVEPEPPEDDPDLLGVYDGVPLTERDGWWDAGSLPDRITIFQGPLERFCDSPEQLREEIAVTVVPRDRPPLRHLGRAPARAGLGLTAGDT